jgi:hypothetical protein
MFVGHGLVAFAIAASVAAHRGWSSERALAIGLVAGLFATLPDVDMLYAVGGLVGSLEGVFAASDAFWAAAGEVHRSATHSLAVGAVAAAGFGAWRGRSDWRLRVVAVGALAGVAAAGAAVSGPVTGAVLAAFVLGGLGITFFAGHLGFGTGAVFAAATLGLLTHPFGDLLTGQPPLFLYPLDLAVVGGRMTLHADPTIHLLGAFAVELATIWLALFVLARLRGLSLGAHVRPRAVLGASYAAAILAVPAPTLEVASPFVFSVLAVGALGVPLRAADLVDDRSWGATALVAVTTALTAVSLAALAYATVYLLVGL